MLGELIQWNKYWADDFITYRFYDMFGHLGLLRIERRTLADPRGAARFFRFDIQNIRNVTASGVGDPPTRNHGSATGEIFKLNCTKLYFKL